MDRVNKIIEYSNKIANLNKYKESLERDPYSYEFRIKIDRTVFELRPDEKKSVIFTPSDVEVLMADVEENIEKLNAELNELCGQTKNKIDVLKIVDLGNVINEYLEEINHLESLAEESESTGEQLAIEFSEYGSDKESLLVVGFTNSGLNELIGVRNRAIERIKFQILRLAISEELFEIE